MICKFELMPERLVTGDAVVAIYNDGRFAGLMHVPKEKITATMEYLAGLDERARNPDLPKTS